MKNELYPWLLKYYKKIVKMLKKRQHHSILINSDNNLGINKLILNIKKWIFCENIKKEYFCNQCTKCNLIEKNIFFDIYDLKLSKIIKVNNLREIIKKILLTPKYSKKKIVYIKNSELLTKLESNTLLKIIEEPPKNTIFFLQTNKIKNIISTLKSRLYIINIFNIKKNKNIKWLLKNTNFNYKKCNQAIEISNNVPLFAKKMLLGNLWKIRKYFYKNLFEKIKKKQIIDILYVIKKKLIVFFLNLIYTILLDSIKYKKKMFNFIINIDQKKLIILISKKFKKKIIYKSIMSWMQFEKNVLNINRINYELILLEQILKWEKILKNNINNILLPEV
ncbi:DNA polymerase III subunit delta' C-terminal domain-containing protein [Buchnera aphidicola (Pseudoregma panicola)]|uniref:DNA polymerase III subunit delta' C-terminal domain-containing protein n=1 Tax=Buchnera aphidicola TaxID=9 RepID=UPI0031B72BF2